MEGIYHDKRCAQGKAGQNCMYQSLQQHYFACNVICKWNVGYHKKGRTETDYNRGLWKDPCRKYHCMSTSKVS